MNSFTVTECIFGAFFLSEFIIIFFYIFRFHNVVTYIFFIFKDIWLIYTYIYIFTLFFLYDSFNLNSMMYDRSIAILIHLWLPLLWYICFQSTFKVSLLKAMSFELIFFFCQSSQSVSMMIKFNPFPYKIVIDRKELLFLLCWLFLTTVSFPLSTKH